MNVKDRFDLMALDMLDGYPGIDKGLGRNSQGIDSILVLSRSL